MLCQDGTSLDRQLHFVLYACVLVCMYVCVLVCMYVCMYLCVAEMAHLLACSVKMAHLWTDSCILCCMRVYLYACECVYLCVVFCVDLACSVKMSHFCDRQPHLVLSYWGEPHTYGTAVQKPPDIYTVYIYIYTCPLSVRHPIWSRDGPL